MNLPVQTGDTVVARPGRSLARYVCLRRIARGGMAELYLARREGPEGFRKLVALKRLLPHLAEDPEFARMFITEARLAAGLDHPSLASVLDFGELEDRSFLAMEYIHGQDLRAVLRAAGQRLPEHRVPLPWALAVLTAIADGLHYAHERRGPGQRPLELVHRDVSPSNVLVGYDGSVKLVDFGIAKATAETQATATHSLKGKIAYMSPEQARGEPVDRRCDIFALGIVAFELTTGFRLFNGPSEFVILNQVARGEVADPRQVVPGYPEPLAAIVLRALAPAAHDRYPTAKDLAYDLRAFAASQGALLDREGLSAVMHTLFEATPYPELDEAPIADEVQDLGPATRSRYDLAHSDTLPYQGSQPIDTTTEPRRKNPLGWASLALAAGLGLGVGLAGTWNGRAETEPPDATVPAAAPASTTETAPSEPVASPGPAEPETKPETEPEPESAEPATEPEPETEPKPARRTRRKSKPRTKKKSTKASKSEPSGLDRWKPPSEQ